MKLRKLALGVLYCSSFLTVTSFVSNSASAQCVQADVAVQYNISGSRRRTDRRNDVAMESNGPCRGNANVTKGVQGNVGGRGQVRQHRQVRNRISGSHNGGMKPVQIKTGVEVDVYNPADNWKR